MLPAMMRTIGEALQSARSRLSASTTAQSDAEELVSRLLDVNRVDLQMRRDEPMAPELWQKLDSWLRRRVAGQPVQYITGRAAFRSLDLAVDGSVLIPRPETEQLVEAVIGVLRDELMRWSAPRVLDLGTGSGAIALSLAREWPQAVVTASDASADALATAQGNAAALGLEGRVRFVQGNWFDAIEPDERFEIVVSNPPYIATIEQDLLPADVRDHEPPQALFSGETGLESLREIIDEAPRHLVADGLLALELAEMRAREVAAWLEGAHDWRDVDLRDDLSGRPRVLLARRERGPAIAPAQWEEERG
jgi:release factor glutamine methyltransferase